MHIPRRHLRKLFAKVIYLYIYIYIYIHHHNGIVATCQLWTTSGGVHALLVLEQTECSTSTRLIYFFTMRETDM